MENRFLRSITFRPHWLGHHAVPGFHPVDTDETEVQRTEKFQSFYDAHQANDPFNLLSAYRDPESFIVTPSHSFSIPFLSSSWRSHRRLLHFYTQQNTTIHLLLLSVDEQRNLARVSANTSATRVRIAIYASLIANFVLSGLQLFAAISSGSLSLFTTMADAIFDPLSNITLILAHRGALRVSPQRFPSGRARLETVGNIIFCFLMMAVGVVIVAFAIQDLSSGGEKTKKFEIPAVVAAAVSFATKLALFLYCWGLRNKYGQVRILWQDHRNDLFINGLGILTSVGGAKLAWWIDPAGAVVLSLGIMVLWWRTVVTEFMLVVGVAAHVDMQRLVTYVALRHEPERIKGVDTVRVYYSGPRLIVEVDVVMENTTQLESAHDVAESLQYKLESLPDVERAYVHVDYETRHKPEHAYVKAL